MTKWHDSMTWKDEMTWLNDIKDIKDMKDIKGPNDIQWPNDMMTSIPRASIQDLYCRDGMTVWHNILRYDMTLWHVMFILWRLDILVSRHGILIWDVKLWSYSYSITIRHSGVATVSRTDEISGLFCRTSFLLWGSLVKETYNLINLTNRSHPISQYSACIHTQYITSYSYSITPRHYNNIARDSILNTQYITTYSYSITLRH